MMFQISSSGAINFGDPLLRSIVPEADFPGRTLSFQQLSIISPLWANYDITQTGDVFHQLYTEGSVLVDAINTFEDNGLTIDSASAWALVVTWFQVPLFEWTKTRSFEVRQNC